MVNGWVMDSVMMKIEFGRRIYHVMKKIMVIVLVQLLRDIIGHRSRHTVMITAFVAQPDNGDGTVDQRINCLIWPGRDLFIALTVDASGLVSNTVQAA